MPRVLCIWFPNWPIQRLHAAPSARDARPLILFREQGQRLSVTACCRRAARHGIRPGQTLGDARAVLPQATYQRAAPELDQAGLRDLALETQVFTPFVGIEVADEPEALLADVSGCPHLWKGERPFLEAVQRFWTERGSVVRLALADTLGTAWAVAHFSSTPALVPSGRERIAISRLPVAALRLPPQVLVRLQSVGLSSVLDILNLPAKELRARFGPHVGQRIQQALGEIPELLVTERLRAPLQAERSFESPLEDQFAVAQVHRDLLRELLRQAALHAAGLHELAGEFQTETGTVQMDLRLVEPTDDEKHLLELITLKWEQLPLTSGILRIVWTAARLAPLARRQARLFEDEEIHHPRLLTRLIDRLSSRLGTEAVLCPRLRHDPQPEHAVQAMPWQADDGESVRLNLDIARSRPMRLLRAPQPLEVISVIPDGPPLQMTWRGHLHRVIRQWGPERIETGWWRTLDAQRDYYRVEWNDGTHVWAFRDRRLGTWFLHGFFD